LTYINRNPGVSLQAVARHLGLTSPTVCKMVDGLVLARLVQREPHARDRRKITLTLTSQGKVVLEQTHQATQDRLAEVLGHLTPQESETVMQAMQLLHPLFLPGASHLKEKPK
jgi:DNA-binding MarR family transcriptional regulator